MKGKKVFTKKHQDVHVVMNWQPLDVLNPPSCPGIYAVTNENMTKWFYIGKSKNISKRIVAKSHPIQVTKDVSIGQSYFYLCVSEEDIGWFERYAIKRLDPEWNGGTSFQSDLNNSWMRCDLHNVVVDQNVLLAAITYAA
jgi:excinuclease UvrABC nuclease subunit